MRTQNKENYYYIFWIIAMVAFIIPQVFTAYAVNNIFQRLNEPIRIEITNAEIPERSS